MADTDRTTRPLEGLRVVDAASFIAGPFVATLLGEFGAEVIKVELPGVGDQTRRFGTPTEGADTLVWLSEGRNKKSVTLDLRKPEGAELFKKLVAVTDVLVENFQTGTLEKWGVGWDVLRQINPRLVMVRITGYGQTGPNANKPGFARIAQGFSGLSFLAGYPDRAPVTPGSATIADYNSGLFGAFGAMLALRARELTGEGQVVDIGLYESVFRILDELVPAFHRTGYVRQRMGPGTVNVVPHAHYPTRDGKWVAIACTTDKIFERLARAMQQPDIAGDGRWGRYVDRDREREAVDAFVGAWTGSLDREDVLARCAAEEVPSGPLYSVDEILQDPHYRARENIRFFDDPRVGEVAVPNVVPRLTATPGGIDHLGPPLGNAVDEVYGGLLGLAAEEIARLRAKGVV